jgi:hypothetical protein
MLALPCGQFLQERHEHFAVAGFGEVVIAARKINHRTEVGFREFILRLGHQDDGEIAVSRFVAERLDEFEAVDVGLAQLENQNVRRVQLECQQHLGAAPGRFYLKAGGLKRAAHAAARARLRIGKQHARRFDGHFFPPSPRRHDRTPRIQSPRLGSEESVGYAAARRQTSKPA